MYLKPCPFCGNMPKIWSRLIEYKFGPEIRPVVHAKVRVQASCKYCGLFMDHVSDVFLLCQEEEWFDDANKGKRHRTKKALVEKVLEQTWNRRAE